MSSTEEPRPIIPESFFGWICPRVCDRLTVDSIPSQGLPKLVLSSAKRPRRTFPSGNSSSLGYTQVEAMVTALSALTKLETLSIKFCLQPLHDRHLVYSAPLTRSVLPSLKFCLFQGICCYLEDFVTMIDTPRLEILDVTLCEYETHPCSLDGTKVPQFSLFLSRTEMFKTLNNASVHFWSDKLEITLSRKPWAPNAKMTLKIMCQRKIFILGRVCTIRLLPLSKIESLGISSQYHKWQSDEVAILENFYWLFPLFDFSAVKSLYLSEEIVPFVAYG